MAIMTLTYAQGKPPEYAVLLCFTTGVVTLLMGLLQLGKYNSYQVIKEKLLACI
jgi:MFS superfamily sulfate permease-like transporter